METLIEVFAEIIRTIGKILGEQEAHGLILSVVLTFVLGSAYALHRIRKDVNHINRSMPGYNNSVDLLKFIGRVEGISDFIIEAGRHEDILFRQSLISMIYDFFLTSKIESELISVDGESTSRLLYAAFWDGLIEAQKVAKSQGRNIAVSVVHSAALDVWEEKSARLINKQRDFAAEGGNIKRLLVRREFSPDSPDDYENVMKNMRIPKKIDVEYIEIHESDGLDPDDYLIVNLEGRHYIFQWRANWAPGRNFGKITSACLYVGEKSYKDFSFNFNFILDIAGRRSPARVRTKLTKWKLP
jgi:hypothetical protein